MKTIIKLVGCIITGCILVVIAVGCSNQGDDHIQQIESLTLENEKLKTEISDLEKVVDDYKLKETKQNELVIAYTDVPEKVRFVEQEITLLALPQEGSKVLNPIRTNTLVTVLDRAFVNEQLWINVQIPVYDTPANNKGWILEEDSVPYTPDKKEQVQSDVRIRAGAEVYETYEFEDIKNTTPIILNNEDRGRLEEKREGYCHISQAGGLDIWVKEESVVYP